jgi:hypothetical protein
MFAPPFDEMSADTMTRQDCSVTGCGDAAAVEVRLYDVYPDGTLFDERDNTCPFLCSRHLVENENGANGVRKPRGIMRYPHSNRHFAQGFTIYRRLGGAE